MLSDDRLWDDTIQPWHDIESDMAWQPKPPAPLEEEEEPWQPIDYFFDEAKLSPGLPVGHQQHGYTGICRYDGQGRHIIGTRHCPHNQEFDETGKIMPQGWTVQKWQ